jgi:hypothetical protein
MTLRAELEATLKKLRLFGCPARLDELENGVAVGTALRHRAD